MLRQQAAQTAVHLPKLTQDLVWDEIKRIDHDDMREALFEWVADCPLPQRVVYDRLGWLARGLFICIICLFFILLGLMRQGLLTPTTSQANETSTSWMTLSRSLMISKVREHERIVFIVVMAVGALFGGIAALGVYGWAAIMAWHYGPWTARRLRWYRLFNLPAQPVADDQDRESSYQSFSDNQYRESDKDSAPSGEDSAPSGEFSAPSGEDSPLGFWASGPWASAPWASAPRALPTSTHTLLDLHAALVQFVDQTVPTAHGLLPVPNQEALRRWSELLHAIENRTATKLVDLPEFLGPSNPSGINVTGSPVQPRPVDAYLKALDGARPLHQGDDAAVRFDTKTPSVNSPQEQAQARVTLDPYQHCLRAIRRGTWQQHWVARYQFLTHGLAAIGQLPSHQWNQIPDYVWHDIGMLNRARIRNPHEFVCKRCGKRGVRFPAAVHYGVVLHACPTCRSDDQLARATEVI